MALLARTVSILPQDRTHAQRVRNPDAQGLFRNPNDWLPPIFAVLVCGFQMTFWEEATVATGEMLNLLLFAYVIRNLAEFRLDRQDGWLFKAALVYGIGMANNWAMLGFLPLFGMTVMWMKGFAFFKLRFLLIGFGLMFAGMLLYFFDPLMGMLDKNEPSTFGELLTWEFVNQRNPLLGTPKGRALMLGVTAILPLSLLAVRWPSNFGDVSSFGVLLASFLIRTVHVVFFVAIVVVAFDPPFSPRQLSYGQMPMLTYYYLGALMAGYLAGYVLLVCGTEPAKKWQKSGGLGRGIGFVLLAMVWLGVIAVPALLLRQNLPAIRVENGEGVRRFARQTAQGLPDREVILMGNDQQRLLLMAVHFHAAKQAPLLAPVKELGAPRLHLRAAARYPEKWPAPKGDDFKQAVPLAAVIEFVFGMGQFYPLWSLDDQAGGPWLESIYAEPTGMLFELFPSGTNISAQADHRHLADDTERFKAVWEPVQRDAISGSRNADEIAVAFSAWANSLGVRHQRAGNTNEASWAFATALTLDTNNISAIINRDVQLALATNGPGLSAAVSQLEVKVAENRSWENLLRRHGPIDEATVCSFFGGLLLNRKLMRQSLHHLERSLELNATNLFTKLQLAGAQIRVGRLQPARGLLSEVNEFGLENLPEGSQTEYERTLALADHTAGDTPAAEKRLIAAIAKFPKQASLYHVLSKIYLANQHFDQAVPLLEKLLEINPRDSLAKYNLGPAYAQVGRPEEGLEIIGELIEQAPRNTSLYLNRGTVYNRLKKFDEAVEDYEKVIELNPRVVEPHLGLAGIAGKRGDAVAARGHFETALKLVGTNSPQAAAIRADLEKLQNVPVPK